MEMEYAVTIASISYNAEEYIAEALDSWLEQKTDFPFEIVVSDDGSTDKTCEIVKDYMSRFPNIRLINTGHIGCMPNFIRSLKASKGKYIALCDGDDYWIDPMKLQKQFDFMETHPDFSACYTNSYVLNTLTGDKKIAKTKVWDVANTGDLLAHRDDDNVQMSPGHTSTFFFRNQFIISYPQWWLNTILYDFTTCMLMSKYGKAKFINDFTSIYRHRPDGISSVDYSFIKNACERIYTYKHVNRDFHFRYLRKINPIIADYYYKMGKRLYKTGNKVKGLWNVAVALVYNPLVTRKSK